MAAISGFRRLLRASRVAFKGDEYAVKQASITLKEEFLKHKHESDPAEIGNNIDLSCESLLCISEYDVLC